MKRALLLLSSVALATVLGAAHPRALSTQVVSCEHVHLSYSFGAPGATDTAYGLSVSASQCGASTSVSGSGSVTFLSLADDSTCAGSLEIICSRYTLNLSTGASPTFTTEGAVYFPLVAAPVPVTTLDTASVETITGFASGHGSGVLNTTCTFNNPIENCTADGSFVWAPGV